MVNIPAYADPVYVLKAKTEPEWRALHRLADAAEPKIRSTFLRAVAMTKSGVILAQVTRALESGDVDEANRLIPWGRIYKTELEPELARAFRDLLESSGETAAKFLPEIEIKFDVTNQRAVDWVRNHTAELVTNIGTETEAVLRDIVRRGFEEGIDPKKMARMMRDHVGLDRIQSMAVENLKRNLANQGVRADKIKERIDRYIRRSLRVRAERIARTEALRASNEGQQELWRQAAERGLIDVDPRRTRRVWLTSRTEVCPICEPLDGKTVGFEENFTGFRRRADGQIAEIMTTLVPPIHPACRCSVALQFMTNV